jgi:hypothetical protein
MDRFKKTQSGVRLEQMPKEISKWPRRNGLSARKRQRANVHRPWPSASDTAGRPLRPGRLPSTSERIAWERAGAARGPWLCCVGSSSPMGIDLPPRLARDPSALPPFRKFISAFALESEIWTTDYSESEGFNDGSTLASRRRDGNHPNVPGWLVPASSFVANVVR